MKNPSIGELLSGVNDTNAKPKRPVKKQTTPAKTPAKTQAAQKPGEVQPMPKYSDIKDLTKPNISRKEIEREAAANNSDVSGIDLGLNDPNRFKRNVRKGNDEVSEEARMTPEERSRIEAQDKAALDIVNGTPSQDTSYADSVYDQGSGYGQYGGYGDYTYPATDVRSLDDVLSTLEPYHVPDGKDLKREKRDMMIRAIGDGISAIAGLVGSASGGPNTVDASGSLTKSGMEMQEKLREQRRKDYTAYLNAALKREQAAAATLRARTNLERSREISRREAMKAEASIKQAERKLDQAQNKLDIEMAYKNAMIEIQKERNRIQEDYNNKRISNAERNTAIKALGKKEKSVKSKYSSRGGKGGGGKGGSKNSSKIVYDEYGGVEREEVTTVGPSGKETIIYKGGRPKNGGSGSGSSGNGSSSATSEYLRGRKKK